MEKFLYTAMNIEFIQNFRIIYNTILYEKELFVCLRKCFDNVSSLAAAQLLVHS